MTSVIKQALKQSLLVEDAGPSNEEAGDSYKVAKTLLTLILLVLLKCMRTVFPG